MSDYLRGYNDGEQRGQRVGCIKTLFVLAMLVIVFIAGMRVGHAHVPGNVHGPDSDDRAPTAEEERLMACGTLGVHAAWGAEAFLRGAPPVMKLAPMWDIKKMFYGEKDIPADGIYVAEELSPVARENYFADTLVGYMYAQTGAFDGGYAHETLTAYFYNACKEGAL
jgi:hypothetical protein